MNISHLRTFVEVVDRGSFSAAARSLGISQPAVTMQIQGLESDIGATLLERRYRRVQLTEAGRSLLPTARGVLSKLDAARDEIGRLSDTVSGHLEIAASTTPGQYVLPRLLGSFLRAFPDVTVSLRVHDTAEVIDRVESGEAHIGVTGAKRSHAKVEFEEVGVDRLLAIAPLGSPIVGASAVPIAVLAAQPFIVREPGSGTRTVIESALRDNGVDPGDLNVVIELGTSEAIVNAVEGGMGVGVVSHMVADRALELGTIARVDAAPFPVERPFYTLLPRGVASRAASALASHLRSELHG